MSPLEALMESLGVEFDPEREGNQSVVCPFHPDRRPSASLRLDEGLFVCFSCGVGGDVIALLMQTRNLSFADAKREEESLAGESDGQVSRRPAGGRGDSLLPRKPRNRFRVGYKRSPWGRGQS